MKSHELRIHVLFLREGCLFCILSHMESDSERQEQVRNRSRYHCTVSTPLESAEVSQVGFRSSSQSRVVVLRDGRHFYPNSII